MKFAICDDEKQHIDSIALALKNYLEKIKEQNFTIWEFSNQFDLLDKMNSGAGFDVVFLDVLMPSMDGTEVAKEIRIKKYPCEIVFVTSSTDYALEAFDLGAIHYVLKPIDKKRFEDAMDRLLKKIFTNVEKTVVLKTPSGGAQKVETFFIEYIESFKHTQTVHLINRKNFEVKSSLNAIFEELMVKCGSQFIMPYKGYIVNQNMIRTIETNQILMQSGAKIPLAKGSFREIKDAYFEYMFNRETQ